MDIEFESGLDRKGRCVIAMSPIAYDLFIDECRFILEELSKEKDITLRMAAIKKVVVICTLSRHPKFKEIRDSN